LDADLAKCFDRINHKALLEKLNTFPTLRRQIKAWLKSGVMDNKTLFPKLEGTPQGGVISPLLANIALHGLENRIKQFANSLPGTKLVNRNNLSLIRSADDFVILHEDLAIVQRCQHIISEWLQDMSLELKPSKTRLTHTLHKYEGKVGFDFLGHKIRQYKVGNYRADKDNQSRSLGLTTLITPSKEKIILHQEEIGRIIDNHKNAPQKALITRLNPVIRGWTKYYSTAVSKLIFSKLDYLTYQKLRAWALRRCTKGTKRKTANKYWHTVGNDNWCFSTTKGYKLTLYRDTPIVRHHKVKGESSP
jgi:RNA-directed DNA polymerase